ncbi:hypothetical protein PJ267_18815 [Arthrobacter sp. OVS8]|nr:hypothetical protein PJ267_18815 [Arthrobacter sp. OVS8]
MPGGRAETLTEEMRAKVLAANERIASQGGGSSPWRSASSTPRRSSPRAT